MSDTEYSQFSQNAQKCTFCGRYLWAWDDISDDPCNRYHMAHFDCVQYYLKSKGPVSGRTRSKTKNN